MTRAPQRVAARVLDVGAVGHRDLGGADPLALRAAAAALFAEIRRHAAAGGLRLRCLCNAAAGADTLLGEAALDLGIELLCLLPLPRAVFARDFSGDAERAAFRRLLAAAAEVEEPDTPLAGPDAYLAAARRLLSRSGMLVAVWDGRPERGPGGTGQIVREGCRCGLPTLVLDPAPPHGVTLAGAGSPARLAAGLDGWLGRVPPHRPRR